MVRRTRLLAVIILIFAGVANAQDFEIDVNLFKGDPKGSREAGTLKRVAGPQIVAKSGEDASVLVGGQVLIGKNSVPVGQQVTVLAKDAGQGVILVTLTLEISTLTGPKAGQVTSTKTQTTATVQSGETVRLELGTDPKNKQWAEITIRSAK